MTDMILTKLFVDIDDFMKEFEIEMKNKIRGAVDSQFFVAESDNTMSEDSDSLEIKKP